MPDPINFTPAFPYSYSYPEEADEPELVCRAPAPSSDPTAGAGGTRGFAPDPPTVRKSHDAPRSCLAPALKTAGSCAALVLSQGVSVLVGGATCLASAIELDECLAAQRAKKH